MAPTFHLNGLQVIDRDAIEGAVRRIVDRFQPHRVVVFGSHARGEGGPDSDLDLFIEMDSELRPLERAIRVRELLADVRWPLDVVVFTPAEVADARSRSGNLMSFIDADGVVVYERP